MFIDSPTPASVTFVVRSRQPPLSVSAPVAHRIEMMTGHRRVPSIAGGCDAAAHFADELGHCARELGRIGLAAPNSAAIGLLAAAVRDQTSLDDDLPAERRYTVVTDSPVQLTASEMQSTCVAIGGS